MNSMVYSARGSNSQTLRKGRSTRMDQNQQSFQSSYNRSSRNSQAHFSGASPLSTLACSINLARTSARAVKDSHYHAEAKDKNMSLLGQVTKRQVVGKGGFGKVWRVEVKGSGKEYALKQMSKALVIAKKSVPSVINEKRLLVSVNSPFLVNLLEASQDRQNLYLLLDYLPGRDLRHHLARKRFSQEEAKFLIVCLLLGLKHLHANSVIHRDIKPENIVLDREGYARITDLGVARPLRTNNSSDTSGTPGYMAPEVLCRQNHSYSADYFAVGVMTYELMLRRRPFHGRSRKQIREEVLAKQAHIKKHQIPDEWSMEAGDFINRLLQRKPTQRLGHESIQQIFSHPWLRNFPVKGVESRSVQAPWAPDLASLALDDDYFSSEDTEIKDLMAENELMLRKQEVQDLFQGYEHSSRP